MENFTFIDLHPKAENVRDLVLTGLKRGLNEKVLPSKLLYDEVGSQLFHKITQQPEYYQTDAEIEILTNNAKEICELVGEHALLVEFGSGNPKKIKVLLDLLDQQSSYMPIDISKEYLRNSAETVAREHSRLKVVAVCADFLALKELPNPDKETRKTVVFFPGSTIGNFERNTALGVLAGIRRLVGDQGGLLIGADLKKDVRLLNAAYDDEAGVTAAFELNLLRRLNRELNADFNLDQFEYFREYNAPEGRIEMYLRSRVAQSVEVAEESIAFEMGERLQLEVSYKWSIEEFQGFCSEAGLVPKAHWVDSNQMFSVHYLEGQ